MILACNITVFYLNDQEKTLQIETKIAFSSFGIQGKSSHHPFSLGFFNDIIFLYWHKSRTFAR